MDSLPPRIEVDLSAIGGIHRLYIPGQEPPDNTVAPKESSAGDIALHGPATKRNCLPAFDRRGGGQLHCSIVYFHITPIQSQTIRELYARQAQLQ